MDEDEKSKEVPSEGERISEERQLLYYFGMVLMGLGVILFFWSFFVGASTIGSLAIDLDAPGRMAKLAMTGMILLIIGALLMQVGKYGAAGSGVILDPKEARRDLRPWSKMAGGVVEDALSEVDTLQEVLSDKGEERVVVKVRCLSCGALNDEDARFCKGCGQPLQRGEHSSGGNSGTDGGTGTGNH